MELEERRLGNFRLNQLLGAGAFADIYVGTHIYLNSRVAIKVLRGSFDAHAQDSFLTEARLLLKLVHPHIIRIIDFGIKAGAPYVVMDYAPFGNLRDLHPPGTRVPQMGDRTTSRLRLAISLRPFGSLICHLVM